jgi:hypothetical protein
MAAIQTTLRVITVRESVSQVLEAMEDKMMLLTEDTTYFSDRTLKEYKDQRKIRLNRDYIIEVYD